MRQAVTMEKTLTQPKLELPPAVMKVVLGLELARLRENRVPIPTQEETAAFLGCSQQKVANIEGGTGIKLPDLNLLLDFYGVDEADSAYARSLQSESQRRTKRGSFSTRFRQYVRLLVDMEASCQRYFSYQGLLIPGLLQTEQHIRTNLRCWRPSLTLAKINDFTDNKLGRQRVLDNTNQRFWFVLEEAALHRANDPSEMKAQIRHLIECIDRPNVELQLIPFDVGYYMGQGNTYTVFGYDTQPEVDIIYREQLDGGEYVDNSKRVPAYLALRDHLKAVAAGPEQTRRKLVKIAASL
jgi:hypothetical protein